MIAFDNVSRTPRAGVKGPGAAAWLAGLGLPTPDAPTELMQLVLRQDLALVLKGARLNDLLLETCSVNFLALDLSTRPVVLTSIVGVGATVIPGEDAGIPCYRFWCDSTYGDWFLQTMTGVAAELS